MTQLAEKMAARMKTKDISLRRELSQDIRNIREEILEFNRAAIKEGRRMDILRITPRA